MAVHDAITGLEGRRFSHLKVVALHKTPYWECVCTCGKKVQVRGSALIHGVTKSCGHLQREVAARLAGIMGRRNRRHGLWDSSEYRCWHAMRHRCLNPHNRSWKRYGGRGIKVCARWHKFENFYADMGPRPNPELSIERIDNDGNYTPRNCKWGTRSEQSKNRMKRARDTYGRFV